jgi:membrane protein
VVIVFALVVIELIFAVLPTIRRTLKSQLPGALLTGLCWLIFTKLFSFFIPKFYHASSLYGSLASLFLVLLWLRFVVMILFAGGVLNRALEEDHLKYETDTPEQLNN